MREKSREKRSYLFDCGEVHGNADIEVVVWHLRLRHRHGELLELRAHRIYIANCDPHLTINTYMYITITDVVKSMISYSILIYSTVPIVYTVQYIQRVATVPPVCGGSREWRRWRAAGLPHLALGLSSRRLDCCCHSHRSAQLLQSSNRNTRNNMIH